MSADVTAASSREGAVLTNAPAARPLAVSRRIFFPTLASYQRAWLTPDIIAGISAGAVVIPQAMAYATIANLPVQVGLCTCLVPLFVYAMLGGSRAMSTSSTSTIATLTATTMVSAGIAAGSEDALGSLVALTLLVGVILLGLRLLRLGSLVENISSATILGIQVGVGATVAVGQLPKLFGVDANFTGHGFIRSLNATIEALPSQNLPTVLLSVGSIIVLFVLKKWAPRVPAALVVVVAGILLVAFGGLREVGVELIAPVPGGLPMPMLPDFGSIGAMVPGAFAIAVMAFLESVAVARGIRKPGEKQIDSDQELFAISAASVAGSFFTTLPAAGGFSQSAVNQGAGARTQLSSLVTVALALLVALFLGPVLSLLPQATLASLVFVAVIGLINVGDLARLARISPRDFWIALATAVVGLSVGLLPAVAVGVIVTLVFVLREINKPRLSVVGRSGAAVGIHLGRGLYTANALENERAIIELVGTEAQSEPTHAVVLDLERLEAISITVLDVLADLDRELAGVGVQLHVAALPIAAEAVAAKLPWYQGMQAAGRVHASVAEGLAAASTR